MWRCSLGSILSCRVCELHETAFHNKLPQLKIYFLHRELVDIFSEVRDAFPYASSKASCLKLISYVYLEFYTNTGDEVEGGIFLWACPSPLKITVLALRKLLQILCSLGVLQMSIL